MNIKQNLTEVLLKRAMRRYEQKLDIQMDPYAQWILQVESKQGKRTNVPFPVFSVEEFIKALKAGAVLEQGWLGVTLLPGTYEFASADWDSVFAKDSRACLVYADEDMVDPVNQKRYGAWFKPDFSYDTMLSFFYFGSFLFLRGALVGRVLETFEPSFSPADCSDRQYLYDFVLCYVQTLLKEDYEVAHVPQVLFHATQEGFRAEEAKKPEVVNYEAYFGFEPAYDACKQAFFKRKTAEIFFEECNKNGKKYHILNYKVPAEGPKVSVIIPSKDNPDVLSVCVRSFVEKTAYQNYELILVDNGSSAENRDKISKLCETYNVQYVYEPMDFNFSKMCNLGVSKAGGAYILLLNDDMEILQENWLTRMLGQAMQEGVGAVGAKLLYPQSDIIQHVGITNLSVGPAHKLLKEHDDTCDYYYGRNVLPYDMIGVTAACLLVSRKAYEQVGGFCEDIAVSYNDVDFCFSLHEKGYRNVIRNDVVLYHHESLSRGDDHLSDEKWHRLLCEKDVVYGRHPALYGKDPFYNPNLAGFKHKYFCSYQYDYERRDYFGKVSPYNRTIPEVWYNNSIMLTVEHARIERKLDLATEQDVVWIEGWAYVLGMDNSRYKRSLILTDEEGKRMEVEIVDRYRPDVVAILPEQSNVAMSGFDCRLRRDDIKPGRYQIAILYRDQCSRQRLFQTDDKPLELA